MQKIFLLLLLTGAVGCQTAHDVSDLYWQLRLEHALGSADAPKDDGLCPANSPARLQWEERAKLATVGMSRSEVEKILPFCDFPEHGPHPQPGGAAVYKLPGHKDWMYQWYYVTPDFISVFIYDSTGPLKWGDGPNQRLMQTPVIVHYDFTQRSSTSIGVHQ